MPERFKLKIGWKWAIPVGACGRSPQSRGGLRQGPVRRPLELGQQGSLISQRDAGS